MTAAVFDFNFSRAHATATGNRKPIRYFSTATDAAIDQYVSPEFTNSENITHSAVTPNTFTGLIFATSPELASSISESESLNHAARKSEKLLLERQIIKFLEFDEFDDHDSTELLVSAVPEALVFINELPEAIPLPKASIDLDGIVTLEWKDSQKKAAAMFEGGDDYGYAYYSNGKYVAGAYKACAGSGIPDDLTSYLTA
ncbi:hypothetical protein QZM35_32970 [Burkholderia sp. AU45274]|uniref:hypothetical protein n=1 Tax=Burkholderia sp. AU45274 TaxID=3059205 RepID=UPI00265493D8|nr:hypothetical protein [Burkholderia sp. AU45274]MDN7492545.1 hypothetical protein [Burkholderia sp. AU45274]